MRGWAFGGNVGASSCVVDLRIDIFGPIFVCVWNGGRKERVDNVNKE